MKKNNNNSVVSLFSGALGLDIGLENAGFNVRSIVECNQLAAETARRNLERLNKNVCIIQEKITKDNLTDTCNRILSETGLKKGEISILSGAPPCQPFSTAGKRQSIMDARGNGFDLFFSTVQILRPEYFVIENVKGILSAAKKHRPLNQRGPGHPPLKPEEEYGSAFIDILDTATKLCEKEGYCISWGVLNAADFGGPQVRERLIMLGSRDGQYLWPNTTHSKEGDNNQSKWASLREAIYDLKESNPVNQSFNDSVKKYLKKIPAGGNWRNLPEEIQKEAIGGAYNSWGGRSGFLRRLSWGKPSPTITQSPSSKATMLCHPTKLRPLSVKECAAIQQFPRDWVFVGGVSEQYKQIGNATPIALAEAVGNEIRKAKRRKKGVHKKKMYCADAKLLEKIIKLPRTILNPPNMRGNDDEATTKKWLKSKENGRAGFKKYQAFCR